MKSHLMNPVALKLTSADGSPFDVETQTKDPAVGDRVTIEGKLAPDGTYIIPSIMKKIIVRSGKIRDIQEHIPKDSNSSDPVNRIDQANKRRTQLNALRNK